MFKTKKSSEQSQKTGHGKRTAWWKSQRPSEPQHFDRARITFARLGLLAYYG